MSEQIEQPQTMTEQPQTMTEQVIATVIVVFILTMVGGLGFSAGTDVYLMAKGIF